MSGSEGIDSDDLKLTRGDDEIEAEVHVDDREKSTSTFEIRGGTEGEEDGDEGETSKEKGVDGEGEERRSSCEEEAAVEGELEEDTGKDDRTDSGGFDVGFRESEVEGVGGDFDEDDDSEDEVDIGVRRPIDGGVRG